MKFVIITVAFILSACSGISFKDNTADQTPSVENRTNASTSNSKTIVSKDNKAVIEVNKIKIPDRVDPNALFKDYSVYFDLDEYTVKEQFYTLLKQHADYLVKHPNQHVFLEGHTDERGGAEYNLALGQRRSNAVRVLLQLYGVKETQMEAYSYGATKPRAPGSDEAAWAQNRRVDLYYKN